jgi:pyridoxal 5'-phosphate synthase pdxT subunit
MLERLGLETVLVREPGQLAGLAMLAMPGGESTTMSMLLDSSGLRGPLYEAVLPKSRGGLGLPVLATCAGVILLARELVHDDGSIKVTPLAALNAVADRNAYGRQVDSFEAPVEVDWAALNAPADGPFHAVFIRAPRLLDPGPGVRVAAREGGNIVLLRDENILACTFHPELGEDPRLHAAVLGWAG